MANKRVFYAMKRVGIGPANARAIATIEFMGAAGPTGTKITLTATDGTQRTFTLVSSSPSTSANPPEFEGGASATATATSLKAAAILSSAFTVPGLGGAPAAFPQTPGAVDPLQPAKSGPVAPDRIYRVLRLGRRAADVVGCKSGGAITMPRVLSCSPATQRGPARGDARSPLATGQAGCTAPHAATRHPGPPSRGMRRPRMRGAHRVESLVLFGTAKGDLGAADGGCGIGMLASLR